MSTGTIKTKQKSKILGTYTSQTGAIEINEPLSNFTSIMIAVAWSTNYTSFAVIPVDYWDANSNNAFPIYLNNGTDTNGISMTFRSSNASKFWFTVSKTNSSVAFSVIGIY